MAAVTTIQTLRFIRERQQLERRGADTLKMFLLQLFDKLECL